tara:strand:- start:319 stop:732 length:414 start_codon:yes stop_codon:yes gene_type:complete
MSILPTPLLKSFVGFDQLFDELSRVSEQKLSNYPAYDIYKKSENNYEINLAVAGFTINDIEIILSNDVLIITGNKTNKENVDIIHKGIANRSFEQKFKLEQLIEVEGALLKDGILSIKLIKNAPEIKKPKKIHISQS